MDNKQNANEPVTPEEESPQLRQSLIGFLYDILFCILAIFAVVLAIREIIYGATVIEEGLNYIITFIFCADYLLRLLYAKDKLKFVKTHILELIAIIPFSPLFRSFRIIEFVRILNLFKLTRTAAIFGIISKRARGFFQLTGLKYMLVITVLCVAIGSVGIHFAEGLSAPDALWWCLVTVTTVGYGDVVPTTIAGRIIAAVLMIIGIGLIGSLTTSLTAAFYNRTEEKHKKHSKDALLQTIQSQLDHFEELTEEDVDTICTTLRALKTKPADKETSPASDVGQPQ